MQPARMLSNVDRRVGVSPGGCRQKLECNIGFMNLIGSCSQIPFEQSINSHSLEYWLVFWVVFSILELLSHSNLMLRRTLGVEEIPPPPANNIRVDLLDLRTLLVHESKSAKLGGWNDVR